MSQTIHNNSRARQAYSLCCVWTPRDGNPRSPLVAIWIDSTMAAFENECRAATPEEAVESNADGPGSCAFAMSPLDQEQD